MDLSVVPIHHNKQFLEQCCDLINSEWKRSKTARLHSLNASTDDLPTSLIMISKEKVIGHAKLSPIPTISNGCFVESVVIDSSLRGQGLGRFLMEKVEEYCRVRLGFIMIYLSTKDKKGFYNKLGYAECEPVSIYGSCTSNETSTKNGNVQKFATVECDYGGATKPPPMLPPIIVNKSSKIYMKKELKLPV